MPRNSRTIITPVSGLNIGSPGTLIDPRQTPRCQNVEIRRDLIRKSRGGVSMGSVLGERILGYGELTRDNVNYLLRVGPTKVQLWGGSSWTNIAHLALTGTSASKVHFAYPELAGSKVIVYTNLTDNIRYFDGGVTDAVLSGTPPKCRYLLNYRGYLLLANIYDGSAQRRSRVQWCDVGDITNWATGDAGSVDLLEDDNEITAMALFGEYASVHKERAIYLGYLTGTDSVFRFDRKEVGSGAIAHLAIVNLPTGEQLYLSREGFRLFNGITAPAIASSINEELADSMNVENIYRSWGILVRELNEAWFGIPIGSDTNPQTVYKYNYLTKTVYKDVLASGITLASLFQKTADDSWDADSESWDSDVTTWDSQTALALHKRVLWAVGDTGLSVERSDSADFNGAAINSQWEGKDFTAADFQIDDPEGVIMEWQGIEVIGRGTTVVVEYSTDEGNSWTTAATLTLGSDYPTDTSPLIADFITVSSKCRPRFSNASTGGAFEIKQFRMIGIPREERRA